MASILQTVAITGQTDPATGLLPPIALSALTAGSTLVVIPQCQLSALFTLTASDTRGNSFVVKQPDTGNGDESQIAVITSENVTAGADSVTISIGFTLQRAVSGVIYEIGSVPPSSVDTTPAIASGTGTTATATSTGALAQATELAIVAIGESAGAVTFGTPSGGPTWTDSGLGQMGDGDGRLFQTWTATTAATTALAPASTLSTSRPWVMAIVTIKDSGGGGGSGPPSEDAWWPMNGIPQDPVTVVFS